MKQVRRYVYKLPKTCIFLDPVRKITIAIVFNQSFFGDATFVFLGLQKKLFGTKPEDQPREKDSLFAKPAFYLHADFHHSMIEVDSFMLILKIFLRFGTS